MTREERASRIEQIKVEVNQVKSTLNRLRSKMEDVSKVRADSLDRIIGRLEDWQHR